MVDKLVPGRYYVYRHFPAPRYWNKIKAKIADGRPHLCIDAGDDPWVTGGELLLDAQFQGVDGSWVWNIKDFYEWPNADIVSVFRNRFLELK